MDGSNTFRLNTRQLLYTLRHIFARRILLYGIATIIGLSCIGFGIWFVRHRSEIKKEQQAAQKTVNAAISIANTDSLSGNFSGSLSTAQTALDKAKTTAQKVEVYGTLAAAATNTGKFSLAITYYNDRHSLDPSTVGPDAYSEAQDYSEVNDNANTIKYLKLALAYYNANPAQAVAAGPGTDPRPSIKNALKEMGQ